MKLSKTLMVIVALALGVLTIASAKLLAAPSRGPISTPCRTPGAC